MFNNVELSNVLQKVLQQANFQVNSQENLEQVSAEQSDMYPVSVFCSLNACSQGCE